VVYDDERELTQYVWTHFQHLMSDFERQMGRAIRGRAQAAAVDSEPLATMLNTRWGRAGDPEVEVALAEGADIYQKRVRDRILSEYGSEVFVNRCPKCRRVVRTPLARQCLWCGADWHSHDA
jgi:hypothetical protein